MDASESRPEVASLVALAERIQGVLIEQGRTLATAESCTGGLIAYVLTEIPGSSDYFVGGIVSYSNGLKESELEVKRATLERHGAVSAQTAVEMADGARLRYKADVAVAVTGIAGPGGGTEAKPVGLTYVGVADENGHDARRFVWSDDRHTNKLRSAEAALALVLERIAAPGAQARQG
jgi:nicotinamide-nucleotide amidase